MKERAVLLMQVSWLRWRVYRLRRAMLVLRKASWREQISREKANRSKKYCNPLLCEDSLCEYSIYTLKKKLEHILDIKQI